jgi:hypothetical protein
MRAILVVILVLLRNASRKRGTSLLKRLVVIQILGINPRINA